MRLIFAGTPAFAAVALEALLRASHDIALVLTQPDRPAGRGLLPQPSRVKQLASQNRLPLFQPATLKQEETIERLRQVEARAMVVAAYGLILPQRVLDLFPLGCINIHASLLPRWRGAAPIQRAIEAGDAQTGISIMRMDAGLDTGPVYLKRALEIESTDTAQTLHDRLAVLGGEAICEALPWIEAGTLAAIPQSAEGATYAQKISKSEAMLNWQRDAQALERQVRAFNPFPVAMTTLHGAPVRIWHAVALEGPPGSPGAVARVEENGMLVECGGGGLLRIESLQRAGGKRLSVDEFLRGMPIEKGDRLGVAA
ncbi:MAG TPA: methionyl-tRNA formyltransferase [Burkholderiales bacterium]|nr:methionyl-tRNA formyltransferase [Burkholderiales bacterium]